MQKTRNFSLFAFVITSAAPCVLAATPKALFTESTPTQKRVATLRAFFDPKPGQDLELDPRDLAQRVKGAATPHVRGFIRVNPPKGICFTITQDLEEPDEVICKSTNMSFRLKDLDFGGRLKWRISTGMGDHGTNLTWTSKYRAASAIARGEDPTAPTKLHYILSCTAMTADRRIALEMASGERWFVNFPPSDTLTPQPDPEPNLLMGEGLTKNGIGAAPEQPKEKGEGHEAAAEKPAAEKTEEKHDEKKEDGKDDKKKKDKADEFNKKREKEEAWYIVARDAYEMPAHHFAPNGSSPRGGQGKCRYSMRGPPDDPKTGQLECHETESFYSILVPLVCLHEIIKPSSGL